MSFGTNIGYLRKKKDMTQEEFAERMFVSRQTVSRWETDSVYPDVETVIKLCELLDCDMETLVRGDATKADAQESAQPQTGEKQSEGNTVQAHIDFEIEKTDVGVIIRALLLPLAAVAFLLMGFIWDLWHPGWLAFVVAVFLDCLIRTVCSTKRAKEKKAQSMSGTDWDSLNAAFCSIVFLVAIPAYLVMGFLWNLWHPGWLIFVAATVLCGISSIYFTLVLKNLDKKKD